MISRSELNPHNYPETEEITNNLDILLTVMNKVREQWGKPMIVTSGLRSQADQARINPKAPKSAHLTGQAVDIKDDGSLFKWCQNNEQLVKDCGVRAIELGTNGWTHLQVRPLLSGHFWFNP